MRNKLISGAVTLSMAISIIPATVSASVKSPAKVTISSAIRTSSSKAKVTWKKLKTTPSGYAVYQKKGSASWKLVKRASKSSSSATLFAKDSEKNQFKIRAYKSYKVKKYYNKKTKKYISKKSYNKLPEKYRSIKTVTAYKYGSYSAIKTLNAVSTTKEAKASTPIVEMTNVTNDESLDQSARRYARVKIVYSHTVSGMDNVKYIVERSVANANDWKEVWVLDASNEGDCSYYCKTNSLNGREVFTLHDYDVEPNTAYTYRVTIKGTVNGEEKTGEMFTLDTPADNLNGKIASSVKYKIETKTEYYFLVHTPEWVELSKDDEHYNDVIENAKVELLDGAKVYVDKYEKEQGTENLEQNCFTKYIIVGGIEK